jgi:Arylsulfotransferase (ASST)
LAEKWTGSGRLGGAITRRRFLGALSAGAAGIALTGTLGCEPTSRTLASTAPGRPGQARAFRTRPDLRPPDIKVNARSPAAAPGYVFVSPKKEPGGRARSQDAPLILDGSGEPVWFHPLSDAREDAFDFKVQEYRGEPVLTWWVGHHTGYGQGEYVVADRTYREITRVRAGNDYEGDHHEFLITPEDTALLTVYSEEAMDLSPVGGPVDGKVLDGIVQEVDIETGEVLFEWHSLDHVGLEESYYRPTPDLDWGFDYFHINSVDPNPDGYLTISARRTSAVYKVDRKTGEVAWRLGGKNSDFEMNPGTRIYGQHDARRHSGNILTIFDNARVTRDEQSRGIVIEVDEDDMTATLVGQYVRPEKTLADTQGNVQMLPGGHVFIGWGSEPCFSEFSHDGELLFDASFPPEVESYRAFRFPWKGEPQSRPAVVAETGEGDDVRIYVSWNGATEVATWRVLAGPGPDGLKTVASFPYAGFETIATLQAEGPYFAVKAEDATGQELATSRAVNPQGRDFVSPNHKRGQDS